MSRKAEIQVGLTVLLALGILIIGVAWIKDFSTQASTRIYRVSFPQGGGLSPSDEVHVNGMRKGEVKDMRLVGDHVEVDLMLAREIPLTTESRVAIRNVGIMGERLIAVELSTKGREYRKGEIVQGVYEPGLGEMMGSLGGTVDAVSSLSVELKKVAESLSGNGQLASTIQNFNRTSEDLRLAVSENRAILKTTLGNFAAASNTAKHLTADREAELRKTLDHFSSAAAKLDVLSGRLDSLSTVLNRMSSRVEGGQGTLGKLVQDDKLYLELNASVQSLRTLIEEIKKNPRKYLKMSIF